MNTPARPAPIDTRGASRKSAAVEIEPIRAQALLLESRKEFVEATRCWQALLEQHPEHAEAANELGGPSCEGGRFSRVLQTVGDRLKTTVR
jgi:hypothetical protein